ncbi:RAI1 like PD-XK nuclease-domain-containing protein [Mycotypha africana]|uniref:RAI1 like PD-XK nuclease-domain-containing protein n=1 Tax=Mycotypha africana TaxID=64632 RepID=UPI00230128E0|nr:RAI1 like PD-XK nuclease-domain-containing protein [Mycotypha africana]KAI8968584.1 RAI1 like PD-XK nuclease-domain-containing protein [Mycotypha africana]
MIPLQKRRRPSSETEPDPDKYQPHLKKAKQQTTAFRLGNWQEYEGSCPVYKQPKELISYSIDHDRKVWFDNREMKYYYPPGLKNEKLDLNVGYERFLQRDESILEHIDTLLDALTEYKTRQSNNTIAESEVHADIITWRGIMTKILCTPYSRKDAWEFRATRYNDKIFIEEQSLKDKDVDSESERQKLMSYWGYRFETICTVSKAPHEINSHPENRKELVDRLNQSANTNVQYCVVVKTKLGDSTIIMGAEVDCCRDTKPNDPVRQPSNYIELKTSRVIETERQQLSFDRYKLLKFWAQSFLVGVPRVICGFRDDEGIVKSITEFKTMEIPRQVRRHENQTTWNPSVCLNFANQLLQWIRTNITVNSATTTYAIDFKYPFREIRLYCTDDSNVFLTQRFIRGRVQHEIGGERAH